MATFAAQPFGPGLFLRDAAFLVAYLERPNFASRALPRAKTGSGADAYETGTDPSHLGAPVTSRERGQGRLARQSSLAQGLGRKPGSSSIRFIQRATWLYGSSSTPPSGDSTT
ncbi:hypothetical protein EA795_06125 [Stutzerimonas nitrititolerans]|uniref:Uncharacterized protein n=1 Tax=Stutzerimonas nitrititolerans TaxID=2482751 RepID=A0ABX9V716_9GAMM|nr:hypothetical protein EA795_06125 [Stutzerimonas nitrititolerans]